MASPSKRRPKKRVEPLDWRELADAPALRGLAEVLSTPPEVARERAFKRTQLDSDRVAATALGPASGAISEISATTGVAGQDFPAPESTAPGGLNRLKCLSSLT